MFFPHFHDRTRNCGKSYIFVAIALLICSLPALSQGWQTYEDKIDHFAFDYPSDLQFKPELDPNGNFVFGGLRDADGKWMLDIDITDVGDYPTDFDAQYEYFKEPSFENFALYQAQLRCDADGPMGSTYCDRAISRKPFVNRYGLQAVELYLNKVDEPADDPRTEQTIGPIYVVRLSDAPRYKILVFFPGEDTPASFASTSHQIADSVRVSP